MQSRSPLNRLNGKEFGKERYCTQEQGLIPLYVIQYRMAINMTKSLRKDFFMEIKKSSSRFISIMLIVALGVAFFAGLRSSNPAMKASADAQYDKENLMDIRVVGTLGLTETDLNKIREIDGVKEAEGSFTTDFICHVNSKEVVTKVISMPQSINDIKCTEGRFPEKYNECLASREFLEESGLKVGDYMTLKTGTSESLFDTLAAETYTIVGVCASSYFLNGNMGTASVGDGVVDGYVVIPKESFATTVYTSIYLTVKGASELNCFGKDYAAVIENVTKQLDAIAGNRCEMRYSEVRSQTTEILTKASQEYNAKKAIAEGELDKAYQELLDSEEVLNESKKMFEEKKKMLEESETEIPLAKQRIAEAKQAVENLRKLRATAADIAEKTENEARPYYEEWKRLAQSGTATEEQINTAKQRYEALIATAELSKAQVTEYTKKIDSATKEIEDGEKLLAEVEPSLANKDQLLADTEKQLNNAEIQLQRGKEQYEIARNDTIAELTDAEVELQNARTSLDNMEVPEWYVLDRSSIESYASFLTDAQSIGALGTVFPLIFFLVAALVCLTTMTRMVEEQRTQIGTLKALGYSKASIVSKYIMYAFLASAIGCIIGVALGEFSIPYLIVRAYRMAYYNLNQTVVKLNWLYAFTASALAILCTCLAALAACYKELRSAAAELMRPKSPKVGKRILIERMRFIWDRLDFAQKAACRNLFRYKRRFFMTLFGVGGCMALLLVGFGINDSVSSMAKNQYGSIFKYDALVSVDSTLTRAGRRAMISDVQDITAVTDFTQAHRSIIYSANNSKDVENLKYAYLVVPNDTENFESFVAIQPRKGGSGKIKNIINLVKGQETKAEDDGLALSDEGVIITEKYADLLGVSVGDSIFIRQSESDALPKEVKVSGITENYMFNYVYMSRSLYSYFYSEEPDSNILMMKFDANADTASAVDSLLKIKGVNSATLNDEVLKDVNEMTGRLIYIIILMIVAAALLAFVVIYNLNNINISERRRELATIKLLGFYDDEVAKYVYRENIVLTVLGTLLGILLGIILHRFVMNTVETDVYMFGRSLKFLSVVISAVLTVVFSMLVNIIMYYKLKKIDMVESLKSVE